MLIAGSVPLDEVLSNLADRRPVFHSERDFQFAFAWQVQLADSAIEIHHEAGQRPGFHLDLEFVSPSSEHTTAIELKYFKRLWAGHVRGQQFSLTDQRAHDRGRYGVVKDISRIEEFVRHRPGSNGAVITLTNDDRYWNQLSDSAAMDTAFHIHDGAILEGWRRWDPKPGSAEHSADIQLTGRYELCWTEFSTFDGGGRLQQLAIEVPAVADAASM